MFINNKYTTWYINLISSAQNRILEQGTYTEKHHIIPKSLGGDDSRENLIRLTAKEHFVAHMLLVRMTAGVYHRKMSFALWRMTQDNGVRNSRHKVTATQYESIKKLMAHNIRINNKGQRLTPEQQEKQKAGCVRNGGPWNKGKKMPPEFGAQISCYRKGTKSSPETRKKISESIKKWNENRQGTPSSMRGRKIPRYTSVIQNKITKEEWTTEYLKEWLQERNLQPHHIQRGLCDYVVIKRWVTKTGRVIFDHTD